MTNEKELVFSLRDYLLYMIKAWRLLIAVAIVFTLICSSCSFIVYKVSDKDPYSEENKEILKQRLTNTESNVIENLFNRYLAYRNSISYSESYLNDSVLMQLDPTALPHITIQYSVDSDQNNIISSFTNQSLGIAEYQQIAAILGDNTNAASVSELVFVSGTTTEQGGIDLNISNQSGFFTGNVNNEYKWIITLNAYAKDKQQCEIIISLVEDAVLRQYQTLKEVGINISIIKLGSNYTENYASWLADRQRNMISQTSSLKSEYDLFEKSELSKLTSDEKAYFEFLKNSYDGKAEKTHILKKGILGGVLSFLVVFVFVSLSYIFSNKLRNKEDYLSTTSVNNVIDIVYSVKKRKGFINNKVNSIINKAFYSIDNQYDSTPKAIILAKRIGKACKRNGISKLFVVTDSSNHSARNFLDLIINYLSTENINVDYGNPLLCTEAYDLFNDSQAVLYYGSLFDSKLEVLSDNAKLIHENNSVFLGSVLHGEV